MINFRKNLGIHAGADVAENFFDIPSNMMANNVYSFALFLTKTYFNDDKAQSFISSAKECRILPHAFHDNNLASPHFGTRDYSTKSIIAQAKTCLRLGIEHLNIHAGSSLKQIESTAAINLLAASLKSILSQTDITIVLENSCGSGGKIMSDLNDYQLLFSILDPAHTKRVEICIDTCHIFAAGYNIQDFDIFLNAISLLPKLPFAFHLNDSKGAYDSKIDRHEKIGKGEIGWTFFDKFFSNSLASALIITETPGSTQERLLELNDIISRYEKSTCQ